MLLYRRLTLRVLLVLGLFLAFRGQAFAQDSSGAGSMSAIEPRNAVSVILMAGLVGGILGLSTLSFYDRPQDNIRNITIGAGVGMISAALFMTYSVSKVSPPTSRFDWAPAVGPDSMGLLAQYRF